MPASSRWAHVWQACIIEPMTMPASLWAAIYVGVAAATLPAVLPVMVGVLTDQLGFGLIGAGYVASANLGGVALGSVLGTFSTRRWSWRAVILVGVITMLATNVFTMAGSAFVYVAVLRFLSGIGEGLVAGICYAALGQSVQAARALAFYVAGQGLVGAVGMAFIPSIVAHAGWQALFALISVLIIPALFLARIIGSSFDARRPLVSRVQLGTLSRLGYVMVACLVVLFIGLSSIWAFLERLGHAKGIDGPHLSMALSASALFNAAGSLVVGVLAPRIGEVRGLVAAFSMFAASLVTGVLWDQWQAYFATTGVLMLSWALYFPLQFGVLARLDTRGTLAAIMPAVTGLGLAIGPALGGIFLAKRGIVAICAFGLACVLASTIASAGVVHRSRLLVASGNPHDMVG